MRGEKIVSMAQERALEKAVVRIKVRLPSKLWARVRRCAEAVPVPVEEWVCAAVRKWTAGKFDGVTYREEDVLGTRDGSETPWVRVPKDWVAGGADLRRALAESVAWHEPRIRETRPQKGTETWVEGRDYIVERAGI